MDSSQIPLSLAMYGGENGLRMQSSALWRSFRNGDFEEEDVWNVLEEKSITALHSSDDLDFFADSSISESVSALGMIPRLNGRGNARIAPKSAPRSIPRWFKPNGSETPWKFNCDDGVVDESEEEEEEEEEGLEERVPPHELIAKRLVRAQISSFSVLEGVGRTLKGRDLSKVRNAVLTKTGFLESL
ncbi:uncharacterized protein LOC111480685 [Cucurbita maxima]|uniref:Uncharacterized protein LOC111480685 n=1 Tax=Cucurbita maxima TaxID=3661 RepID=A0A6J1IX28_CUCMA|nr:uncharacterized protein LOC111480685 [Cucurbita maxima]